jgi:hypothetical protein
MSEHYHVPETIDVAHSDRTMTSIPTKNTAVSISSVEGNSIMGRFNRRYSAINFAQALPFHKKEATSAVKGEKAPPAKEEKAPPAEGEGVSLAKKEEDAPLAGNALEAKEEVLSSG